jgi:chaperonin GroES
MSAIRLLGARLLVASLPKQDRSAGGIMFPQNHDPQQDIFRVLAVGPGRKLKDGATVPVEAKSGDHILVDKFSIGSKVEAGPGQFIIEESAVAMVMG